MSSSLSTINPIKDINDVEKCPLPYPRHKSIKKLNKEIKFYKTLIMMIIVVVLFVFITAVTTFYCTKNFDTTKNGRENNIANDVTEDAKVEVDEEVNNVVIAKKDGDLPYYSITYEEKEEDKVLPYYTITSEETIFRFYRIAKNEEPTDVFETISKKYSEVSYAPPSYMFDVDDEDEEDDNLDLATIISLKKDD